MTALAERKTKLTLETPYLVQGRALVAHVEAWGLKLRPKGKRYSFEITWAQIHNRATAIAAEKRMADRALTQRARR